MQPPVPEVFDADGAERRIEPLGNFRTFDGLLFEPECDLFLDCFGDGLGLGFLEDHARGQCHPARGCARRVVPGNRGQAGHSTAMELRDEAVEDPQERRFSARGAPGEECKVAAFEGQVDVAQGGCFGPGVPVGEAGDGGERHRAGSWAKDGSASGARSVAVSGWKRRTAAGHAQSSATAAPRGLMVSGGSPANGL